MTILSGDGSVVLSPHQTRSLHHPLVEAPLSTHKMCELSHPDAALAYEPLARIKPHPLVRGELRPLGAVEGGDVHDHDLLKIACAAKPHRAALGRGLDEPIVEVASDGGVVGGHGSAVG